MARLFSQISANLMALKPTFATSLSGLWAIAEIGVWQDVIKGWAALITVVIGVPTAVFICAYWALKFFKEWRNTRF